MSVSHQKFREIVFLMLYSFDTGGIYEEEIVKFLMNWLAVTKKHVLIAQERVQEILAKKNEIDALIAKISVSYSFERIQTVERNILRVGAYELLYDEALPPKVAISEAIRLARKFGTPESAAFVNALLDQLYKQSRGEKVNPAPIEETSEQLKKSEEASQDASKKSKQKPTNKQNNDD